MKNLLFFLFFFKSILSHSQNPDEIKIRSTGYGENKEEALIQALRTSIENAYGVFISTETTIINDELVKDEIRTLGKGNIVKYDIINEVNNNSYSVTVDAIVSLQKMMKFGQSEGQNVKFNGNLFAKNLKLQELYEKNELSAIKNFIKQYDYIYQKSFDFSIKYSEPKLFIDRSEKYVIDIEINTHLNNNSLNIEKHLLDLKFISMDLSDVIKYSKLNKPVYSIIISLNKNDEIYLFLRSEDSFNFFMDHFFTIPLYHSKNYELKDGVNFFKYEDISLLSGNEKRGSYMDKKERSRFVFNFKTHYEKSKDLLNKYKIGVSGIPKGYGKTYFESQSFTHFENYNSRLRKISKSYGKKESKKMGEMLKNFKGEALFTSNFKSIWIFNLIESLIKKDELVINGKKYGDLFVKYSFPLKYNLNEIEKLKGFSIKKRRLSYFGKTITDLDSQSIPEGPSIPEGINAETVVNKYIEAIGGAEKVDDIKTIMVVYNATIQGQLIVMTVKSSTPNKTLQKMSTMGTVFQKYVFNGETGYNYQASTKNKTDMQQDQIDDAKSNLVPFADMAYKKGDLNRIEPIDGVNFYVVQFNDTEVFYNMKTGLKYKEVKTVKTPDGKEVRVPTTFGNYTDVNGVLFPYSLGLKFGQNDFNFEVKNIKVNEGVSDSDFK
jgi:hypothetical protein